MPIQFSLKKAANGLVSTGMPFIFKGMINEFLTDNKVDIHVAVEWVQKKKDLLTLFKEFGGSDFENMLMRAHTFVADVDWLTSEYLIDACRDEHPVIASLFLGWDEGRAWLDLQTETIRKSFMEITGQTEVPPDAQSKTAPQTAQTQQPSELSAEIERTKRD